MIQQVTGMREAVLHAIFLDLRKSYNALERSRCLGFLEGYCLGTRSLHLLRRYWERLQMVERAGGVLHITFLWRERCNTGGSTVANHP